jgi:hydroxymethylpyrimidine/phosphomethylpyrimidine kinase
MRGRLLIVAGSDSGGGAGIQADIKTATALGAYAMTAITALTAQNTEGVFGVHEVPPPFVAEQMRLVLADIGADCVKTGMLHRADVIEAVARALDAWAKGIPVVVDPVMVAKGGHPLIDADATAALKARMVPRAAVLTPNAPEAEALTGIAVGGRDDAVAAARALARLGARAVLVKGGHVAGDGKVVADVLVEGEGPAEVFESPRIDTRSTHGTGCTLASAIAAGLAQGLALRDAVVRARAYVREAMLTAPGLGRGHGPLNHAHTVRSFGIGGRD